MANLPSAMDIDMDTNIIRERSASSSKNSSRESSIFSQASFRVYYKKIEAMNNLTDNKVQDSINSSQLSYSDDVEAKEDRTVKKVADNSLQHKTLHLHNKALAPNNTPNF